MASVPLTLTDLFGDQPHEEIVEDVYGDGIEMLIGHLDPDQITDRLSRQAWWQPGMAIDPDSIDHAWVTFDEHTAACDAPDGAIPGRGCDCSWSPWILYHWRDAHPTLFDIGLGVPIPLPGGWICSAPVADSPHGWCGRPVHHQPCPEHGQAVTP